jgi:fructosamine-3-kinase
VSVVREALRELGLSSPLSEAPLSGGSIHDVRLVQLEGGDRVVCKVGNGATGLRMMQSEYRGITQLGDTGTVRVPLVYGLSEQEGAAVLIMEHLPRSESEVADWIEAAHALARLHACDAGDRYGSDEEVWLGGTQCDAVWCDTWPEYLGEHWLRPLLRDVASAKSVSGTSIRTIELLIDRLPELIPARPRPSILHGDLWSGNLHPAQGVVAVLDPACFVGDPWADPAMTLLFGGVPPEFVQAWRERHEAQSDTPAVQERITVVQVMHLLNHVRLFGSGYTPRLMDAVSALL